MKKITLFTLFILCGLNLFAQGGRLSKANTLFEKLAYAEAIPQFEKICSTDQDTPELREKLAYCYLRTNQLSKAELSYNSLVTQRPSADNYYWLAYTLTALGKYAEAQPHFAQFAKLNPSDSRAQLWEKQKDFWSEIQKDPAYFTLKEVGINTEHADFGVYPYPLKNSAVMISSRQKSGFGDVRWGGNNDYFLELFYVQTGEKGYLSEPILLERPINSIKHDGPLCFSSSGQVVYYTSNNRDKKTKLGKDGIQHLKIYIADVVRSEWVNVREFPYNSADYACGHPALSADGKTLYFASDMPGGFGGADIYACTIDDKGQFGKPVNLGANINTSGQELFPWMGSDKLLYFASNGRPGLGGLDLFAAPVDAKTAAKNLGMSVNSTADDFALTYLANGKWGYLSSNRKGSDDIYAFEKIQDVRFNPIIKMTIVDKNNNNPLAFAKLSVKDQSGTVIASVQTDTNGAYQLEGTPGASYTISVIADKYDDVIKQIVVPKNAVVFEQKIGLSPTPDYGVRLLVSDTDTKAPLAGVAVVLTDLKTKKTLIDEKTLPAGDVSKQLKGYKVGDELQLKIELSMPGYLNKTIEFKGRIEQEGVVQLHEKIKIELQSVSLGGDLAKMLRINPIYFDLGKYNIRKDAAIELDKIVKVMNENPTMVIELGSHTDCRSSIKFNETLSSNRAKSSAAYIQQRISNPSRIYGKGYGESRLLNDCGCEGTVKSTCTEEQHQLNRRTEFIIIKM